MYRPDDGYRPIDVRIHDASIARDGLLTPDKSNVQSRTLQFKVRSAHFFWERERHEREEAQTDANGDRQSADGRSVA
jgi:hypothetical protein